jgi:hypothetical protein
MCLAACLTLAPTTAAAPVHFLVAERPDAITHGDSYVLSLTEPSDVAQARALITAPRGELSSIVVAGIAPGADGVNRDWRATGAPAWSWHITDFQGFFDTTAEVLDGWPTFVEGDVDGWIDNSGGAIGFWSYTVVAEIAAPEPDAAAVLAAASLALPLLRRGRRAARGRDPSNLP